MNLQRRIEMKLRAALAPSHLEVINESWMHTSGKKNPDAETHFKVVIVSAQFEGVSAVRRHQLVYGVLGEEMTEKPGVHALAITSRSPAEWAASPEANASPQCRGGGA
jgi:BolA protein